jgi:predicted DCC family thiol-disulfide oxidoreductase YuxK
VRTNRVRPHARLRRKIQSERRSTFLFDGDCAFCSACARFIDRHILTDARVEAWQFVDIDALGLTVEECDAAVQWVLTDPEGRRSAASGPAAIAALLRTSTVPWRIAGWILGRRPVLAVAWPVYRWVARNRDRMPGGTPACAVPSAERRYVRIAPDAAPAAPTIPAADGEPITDPDTERVDTAPHG